jgi:hypothetical protein
MPSFFSRMNLYNALLDNRHECLVRPAVVLLRPAADGQENMNGNFLAVRHTYIFDMMSFGYGKSQQNRLLQAAWEHCPLHHWVR